jgi:integrase
MNHLKRCTKNGKPIVRADYIGSDGKRHFKFLPTAEQAEDFLASATIESRQPTQSDLPATITVAGYAAHWSRLVASHLKPRTRSCYAETLRLHILPAVGATRVRDLQRGRIKAFLATKLEDHKPNSVRLMHATLRVVLNAAVDDGLIVGNPCDKLGKALKLRAKTKVRQEHIKAMDRNQRDRFLAVAYTVEPWFAPMWEVQVLSGLRPGEVYALEEADLDLDEGTARIERTLSEDGHATGTCKGGRGRTIDLSSHTVDVLRKHSAHRKAQKLKRGWPTLPLPFFCLRKGTYASPGSVRDAFDRVVKAATLPHFTPHSLRHTYASLLLTAGVDVYYVSRMLGHASISETVDTYGRWLPANRKGTLDVLDTPSCDQSVTKRLGS